MYPIDRSNVRWWGVGALAVLVALLALAPAARAQDQTGSLYGAVTDNQGAALPGVRVELTGIGAPRTQFTGPQGQFRFLNLDPGNYALAASLEGFSTVEYPEVNIRVGRNTTLEIKLSPAVEEVITVTSESPLLDERKVSKGTTISQIELEKIPTARDPWAIVTQTPGVLSDRINVGGSESGQQAMFTAPAATDDENSFAVDGVVITDMAAIGSSPTYYDFDQFEEIQVSTGGTDIEKISSGASLNLVTKRGSNSPRGSARYLLTDADKQFGILEQATPDISGDLENGDGNGGLNAQTLTGTPGNQINEVVDFGFEAGGPIVRDRLWVWGSYGRNDIKQFAQNGDPDNTLLENSAIKFNGQPTGSNSIVGSWNRGDKIKDGRRPASNFASEATWNQTGPTEVWKIEDTHVFSADLYLTGLYSYVDGGFSLQSKGAGYPSPNIPITQETLLDVDGIYKNSYYGGLTDRNTDNYQVDGSYFFSTGSLNHELKFGVSYRDFKVESPFGFPGRGLAHLTAEGAGNVGVSEALGVPGDDAVFALQTSAIPTEQEYTAGWLQDTLTSGAWTINAGLRYDDQSGKNEATTVAANPSFPQYLAAKSFNGNDGGGFTWQTISPRVGVTYALGEQRKTLVRASYSRFAEQLSSADITRVNPTGASFIYAFYDDANGNNFYDDGERFEVLSFGGFDPNDPAAISTPNVNDPNLDPSLTDEIVAGVEHALLPEFVVGLDLTYRKVSDILVTRPFIIDETGTKRVATRDDYVFDHSVTSDGVDDSQPAGRQAVDGQLLWLPRRYLGRGGRPADQRRLQPRVPRCVTDLHQAPLQPLDGPWLLPVRQGGLELRQRGQVLRRPERRRHRRRRYAQRSERRPVRRSVGGLRSVRERVRPVDLVGQRQRPLPGRSGSSVGLQPRRQPVRPPGLSAALFVGRADSAARIHGERGDRRRGQLPRRRHRHSRSAAREGHAVHRQPLGHSVAGCVQREQRELHPRP